MCIEQIERYTCEEREGGNWSWCGPFSLLRARLFAWPSQYVCVCKRTRRRSCPIILVYAFRLTGDTWYPPHFALTPPSTDRHYQCVRLSVMQFLYTKSGRKNFLRQLRNVFRSFFYLIFYTENLRVSPRAVRNSAPNERWKTTGRFRLSGNIYIYTYVLYWYTLRICRTQNEIPNYIVALFPEDNVIPEDDPKPV